MRVEMQQPLPDHPGRYRSETRDMTGPDPSGTGRPVHGGPGDGRCPLADLPEALTHDHPGVLGRSADHKLGTHLHATIVTAGPGLRHSRAGKRAPAHFRLNLAEAEALDKLNL